MGAFSGVFAPTDTQIGTMGAFSGVFAPTDTQIGTMGAFSEIMRLNNLWPPMAT